MLPITELQQVDWSRLIGGGLGISLQLQKSENTSSLHFKLCLLALRCGLRSKTLSLALRVDRSCCFKAESVVHKLLFI